MGKLSIWNGSAWEEIKGEKGDPGDSRLDPGTDPDTPSFASLVGGQAVWVKVPYLTPMGYGAAGNGTTDDTAAVSTCAIAATAAGVPMMIDRPYRVNAVTVPDGAVIEWKGEGALIRTVANANVPILSVAGTLGTPVVLNVDALTGAGQVVTTNHPGLVPGDYIYMSSERDPWSHPVNRPDRDVVRVVAISGTGPYTVSLADPLAHTYRRVDNARLTKINAASAHLINPVLRFTGSATGDGIHAPYTAGVRIDGGVIDGWRTYAVKAFTAHGIKVNGLELRDTTATGTGMGYGVGLGDGTRAAEITRIRLTGGAIHQRGVTITTGASYNSVLDSEVVGGGGGFDTHGGECRGNRFARCRVLNTVAQGFVTGNGTFGGDFGTMFDACEVVSAASNLNGVFLVTAGSDGATLQNCKARGGTYTVLIQQATRTAIRGGAFGGSSSSIIHAVDAMGGIVQGVEFSDGPWAVRTLNASDGWSVTANTLESITASTPVQLAGANNLNANNLTR